MPTALESAVENWFRRRSADAQAPPARAPMIAQALAALFRRRQDHSPAELEVRERALYVRELPVPPQNLIDWVGGGDAHVFQTVGLLNTLELMIYCRLQPWHHVLEPGCGCGRNARYIAPYLDPSRGRYEGFDIHSEAIAWATETITGTYPHVRFTRADIENSNYNPSGAIRDSEYAFPYAQESFDLAFLPSVFTHLERAGFERYAGEIQRVLKPNGILLSWHFLLNDRTRDLIRAQRALIDFKPHDEVSAVLHRENPCAAIAFDEGYVLETLENVGLRPQLVLHGGWSGDVAEGLVDAQDRIVAVKRG